MRTRVKKSPLFGVIWISLHGHAIQRIGDVAFCTLVVNGLARGDSPQ